MRSSRWGERLRQSLDERGSGRGIRATGWGSIIGLHATEGEVRSPGDLASVDVGIGELLFHGLLERGFYMAPRGFIALSLAVNDQQIDAFLRAFDETLDEIDRVR